MLSFDTICRYVGRFVPRKERLAHLGDQRKKFTNVYLKNFGDDVDDEKLRVMCEVHGTVASVKVMFDDKSGRGKGFGFVSFEDHSAAQKVGFWKTCRPQENFLTIYTDICS